MAGLTEVARFFDVYEAELAAGFLVSHGMDAIVADRGLATMDPLLQTALGGVRLLVPAEKAHRARELLEQAARGEFAGIAEEPPAPRGGRLFPLLTFLSALAAGHGYAGRAYLGSRGHASAVQIVGLGLSALVVLAAVYSLVASRLSS